MFSAKINWYLIFVTIIALLNNFQGGINLGWTSPVLSIIQSPNSTIVTTSDDGSWIASVAPFASMFFTPVAAACVHVFGSKASLFLLVIPFAISWVMTGLATTAKELIYARAMSGLGMAMVYIATPVYLGEIAPDNLRSAIGICINVMMNTGILFIYGIGPIMDIWLSSVLCSISLVLFILLYKFLPESPYFLLKKNKKEEAKEVLKKLRNRNVDEEFATMEKNFVTLNFKESMKSLCTEVQHQRAVVLSVSAFFFSQFTGGITFMFYAHIIFQKAGDVSANTLSVIKATTQLVSSILAAYVVESTGKRPLLIISCIGSSIFMAAEGIYFYLHDNNYNVESIWWVPLAGMILFNMFQVIGLLPIPIAFLGELFDNKVKTIAVCISKSSLALSAFIVGKAFQIIMDNFGNAAPFFIFSGMGILALLFVIFFVPETRGRSLDEIQYYFKYKTFEKINVEHIENKTNIKIK